MNTPAPATPISQPPTTMPKAARAHGPGDLTMTAVILFALGAYGVAAGSVTGEERAVAVGVFAFTLFAIGIVWPIVTLARVRISMSAPPDATVGDIVPLRITVEGHASRVEVRVLDPTGRWWRTGVPTNGVIPHLATRRGVFDHVRVQIRTSAPLGVFLRTRQARIALPTADHGRAPSTRRRCHDPPGTAAVRGAVRAQRARCRLRRRARRPSLRLR